jgi:serine/threonine protein phosphatase 1
MIDSSLAPGQVPAGRRIYAIGDVHGCLDRLVDLHWKIAADLAAFPVADSVLIHLGDYVDRGPDSAGVVTLLAGTIAPPVSRRVDLKGNHEDLMLGALAGNRLTAGTWLDNGGEETLRSYGVAMPPALRPEAWRTRVPPDHQHWLAGLDMTHREGSYLFVHAGLRPGVSIRNQSPEDMMWIREPFLSDRSRRDVVVVHGHTPSKGPEVLANRICIDTGAVMGGQLTCLVLETNQLRFLST